ncbi:uncharacterized protein LOC143187497 [Calliopsis andreniformis]|uniref:uncharacterized protein LOC143187497 n=1 Tax=Calliopsis andreniformis TaxID=337506 RepID=UPI003FCD0963
MAGTANDYVGTLSKTRAGYTCDKWPVEHDLGSKTDRSTIATIPKRTRRPSVIKQQKFKPYDPYPLLELSTTTRKIATTISVKLTSKDREYFNDTLYPDGSADDASNYCRNPSRNIAGTWCYTTDPYIFQDLCNVRDCEKPEEYTFLVKGDGTGRYLYILPEHRVKGLRFSLKAWEPDQPDTITFVFRADDDLKKPRYILKIGGTDNEKILLYHEPENEAITLVKKKSLTHLLYLGKWSNFILHVPRGKILLYYEDDPMPLFEWTYENPSNAFLPTHYYYSTEKGRTVGVTIDFDSSCQIENTVTDRYSRILSLTAWNAREVIQPKQVTFYLRGRGVISVPLYLMLATTGVVNKIMSFVRSLTPIYYLNETIQLS